MPQMAPMSWLNLFFFFIALFLIINILNYYNFLYSPYNTTIKYFKLNKTPWKW